MVGYDNVAALARDAGITDARGHARGSPGGAYSATPIQMAGAYSTFANSGTRITPWEIASVRATNGDPISDHQPDVKPILDPRVAYLTTNMLQNVLNTGTAAGVRSRGFLAPAAAKTGTSRDAWFAGYTSNLICIIWVGNDDYSDIKLEGAQAAAPIWAASHEAAPSSLLPDSTGHRYARLPHPCRVSDLVSFARQEHQPPCRFHLPRGNYYAAFLEGGKGGNRAHRTPASHPATTTR